MWLVLLLAGCGAEGTQGVDDPEPEPLICDRGYRVVDAACVPAGMTAEACPPGFAFAGELCLPQLPGDCPAGAMALPGESACRPVSPCEPGPWGDIVTDASTQHVDGSYTAADADGSATRPWPTIAEGIAAATPGAVVAVARGTYAAALTVTKPVTIWGVCPAETTITATASPTVLLREGSAGTVLRGVGLSGTGIAVIASGTDVALEQVWVHDVGDVGVASENTLGPAAVALRDSLVESYVRIGVQAIGTSVAVERSVVGRPAGAGRGAGIWIFAAPNGVRSQGTVLDTVIDRPQFVGLIASASDVVMERSAVIAPTPSPTEGNGWGVLSQAQPETGEQAQLTISQSAVMHASELGISLAGGRGAFSYLSVLGGVGGEARGIEAEDSNGVRAELSMNDSTVAESQQVGILCSGSDVALTAVQVRDVQPSLEGTLGRGVMVQTNPSTLLPSTLVMQGSLVRDNLDIGLLVANSTASVVDTGIYATTSRIVDGTFGDGISVVTTDPTLPGVAELTRVTVRDNARAGVGVFGATASLSDSAVGCNGFDLNAETLAGVAPVVTDLGGNLCGCEGDEACKVLSSSLAPPDTL